MTVGREPALADVPQAFAAVATKGHQIDIAGDPFLGIDAQSHVQGVARYKQWWILSYSHLISDHGYLLAIDADRRQLVSKVATPATKLDHPGGIQMCGEFLVVPVEKCASGEKGSQILLYDLSKFDGHTWPAPRVIVERSARRCGAAGITLIEYPAFGAFPVHLVVGHDNGRLHFYYSNGQPLDGAFVHFEDCFHTEIPNAGTEAVALVTGWDRRPYLIALRSAWSWAHACFEDHVALYAIDLEHGRLAQIGDARHLVTDHGAIVGASGVHLRWGAGIRVVSERAIEVLATQQHFVGRRMTLNVFAAGGGS